VSSIFLSHTSLDKPFVEKLANDLKRLGVRVWFDKWEIKIGESITWKIEDGVRENEFLGIVLSPESLQSEWVKSELSAAWMKQMKNRKVIVLPILYRECELPLFLQDRKYANFTSSYESGLRELADVFGIKNTSIISKENWRSFVKTDASWKSYREEEFKTLATKLIDGAVEYNWSVWMGGDKLPFSISLSAYLDQDKRCELAIRLDGRTNAYYLSSKSTYNPNHLKAIDFDIYIGNTIEQVEEFCWRKMEDFKLAFGNPKHRGDLHDGQFLSEQKKIELAKSFVKSMRWYQGDNL
jgi:hypothetical protein